MKYFKIEKFYRGGSKVYYAKLPDILRLDPKYVESQLSEWGEETGGGEAYGYRMDMKPIRKLPKDARISLEFNEFYLIPNKKKMKREITEEFVDCDDVESIEAGIKFELIDNFIRRANSLLKRGHFSMNTSLDNIPNLGGHEFFLAQIKAREMGWSIKKNEDEHNTVTYKFIKRG